MKKYRVILFAAISLLLMFIFNGKDAKAAELIASNSIDNGVEKVSSIQVFDNGKVIFQYKYGLRKAVLYYCEKGEQCDSNNYLSLVILESSEESPYKNTSSGVATFNYQIKLNKNTQYSVIVEGYFGATSNYKGTENIYNWPIRKIQADTGTKYINAPGEGGTSDSRLNGLLGDIQALVNKIVLPTIYALTSLFLVVKGAILGFEIVKKADDSTVRSEKIGALKWLVIGVAITYAAASVIGLISGFFKENLNF